LEMASKPYYFDRIFDLESSQDDLFDELEAAVRGLLVGNRLCLLSYGQAGSGKTHSVAGTAEHPGVALRIFDLLLREAEHDLTHGQITTHLTLSVVEVKGAVLRDLLAPVRGNNVSHGGGGSGAAVATSGGGKKGKASRGRGGELFLAQTSKGTVVDGLSARHIDSVQVAADALQGAWTRSHQDPIDTDALGQAGSFDESRAQAVHVVAIVRVERTSARTGKSTSGLLHLADLAASDFTSSNQMSSAEIRTGRDVNKALVAVREVYICFRFLSCFMPCTLTTQNKSKQLKTTQNNSKQLKTTQNNSKPDIMV
jgi:hypothetical protein